MSGGTFSVSRGLWDHAAFKREKFTEREAWIWMLGEASWKGRVTRAGDLVVPLERGQLVLSSRFAAKCWGWTDSKVRRFIERLQKLEMVSAKTDAGVTVITICNYDDYQGGGAASDAGPTQDRRRTDANENKDEIQREEGEEDTDVSLTASAVGEPVHANELSQAVSRYNSAAAKAGWPQVQKLSPSRARSLRSRLKDCGGAKGWEVALRKAFDSDFCRGRTAQPWTGFGFDWLIKSANFTKLMEGNYDNRTGNSGHQSARPGGSRSSLYHAAAAVAARRSSRT
ncbi:hypothetical protein [Salipiger bermudensis]|uniref:hypothetical protein n=1 Tax=Salipiger bermudensis TaxID=344736 RepID=UPI001CD20606|nr:hypothetical protein [Salipiger bermudensis]MCA0961168.1 hypothetical protein [Salipiger bermudensis]